MAYQSLEDRIVKTAFAAATASRTPEGLPVVLPGHEPSSVRSRGAERADAEEIDRNPRSAPVRLRAVERLGAASRERGERVMKVGRKTSTPGRSEAEPEAQAGTGTSRHAGRRNPHPPHRRAARAPRVSARRPGAPRTPWTTPGPQTAPTARPAERQARPKTASQAKARSKARKAKAPKSFGRHCASG